MEMVVAQLCEYIYHSIIHFNMNNFMLCKSHLYKNEKSLESPTTPHQGYYN